MHAASGAVAQPLGTIASQWGRAAHLQFGDPPPHAQDGASLACPQGGPPLQLGRRPGPRKSHRLFEVISVFGQVELQVEVEGARCKHVVPKLKSRVQGAIATAVW